MIEFDSFERMDLKIQNDNFETTWVEIVNKLSKNIVVASIYRHPRYNFAEFFAYLEKSLNILTKENKEIYLCGDFNIDLLQIETINSYQQFYDMLCSYGFLPKIIQPTRVTEFNSSLIDNIFSNNISDDTKSGNILLTLSEHFSQFVSVSRARVDISNLRRVQHDYSKFNKEKFREDVSIQNWNNDLNNANDLFIDFHFKLKGCVDRHAPLKQLTPKEAKIANKPWITPAISKMIKIRNKIFARKKRQPSNVILKRSYNLFRNRASRELKKSKKNYYQEYFEENKNNIKNIWSGIREIVNIRNPNSHKISQLKVGGKLINNPRDISNQLNEYFVNVGPTTEDSIPKTQNVSALKFMKERINYAFLIAQVSHDEVLDIINSLEYKATGPVSIPIKLLKLIPDLILVPLCNIINVSFNTGVFPNLLKLVKVIPIHKCMYKLRPFVNLQIMKNTYHALFYSHIVYGIHVWGNASDSHVKAIQILQNRVVRLITYNDTFPLIPGPLPAANPLFYKLELLKIKEIFIFMVCIFIYKCLNTLSSLFEGWFIYSHNIHTYKTRSNYNIDSELSTSNLFVPLARTSNYGLKLMKVNGPKIWNTIPNDIRSALSLLSFKKLIKKYLIYNYNLI